MTEDRHQTIVMNYVRKLARKDPRLKVAHHVPNGGRRSKSEAHTLKLMGVVAGIPDINIPVPVNGWPGLFIEMKKEGGRLSKEQKEIIEILESNGYCVKVCIGHESAIKVINEYLEIDNEEN